VEMLPSSVKRLLKTTNELKYGKITTQQQKLMISGNPHPVTIRIEE
jgi:hypothetical protein